MAAPQRWWLVAKANPINRSKAFNGQLSFLTFICVSTMHKGYPHTVNSPLYSDWKNCRWIMFYIKVQSVRREPGSPPTHVSYDINICDSLFSCSCKKSSNISYKTNPETCLQKKKITACLLLIVFFFNQALSQSNAFCPKFLHIPKYHTGMWIQQHFVLSYPFPSFICGRRFLLGKTGIVKQLSITLLLCFARLSILILVSPQLIPLHQETQARTFCTVCSSHWYPAAFQYCASCFASQERKKMFLFITIIVKTARNSFADCKIYSL